MRPVALEQWPQDDVINISKEAICTNKNSIRSQSFFSPFQWAPSTSIESLWASMPL